MPHFGGRAARAPGRAFGRRCRRCSAHRSRAAHFRERRGGVSCALTQKTLNRAGGRRRQPATNTYNPPPLPVLLRAARVSQVAARHGACSGLRAGARCACGAWSPWRIGALCLRRAGAQRNAASFCPTSAARTTRQPGTSTWRCWCVAARIASPVQAFAHAGRCPRRAARRGEPQAPHAGRGAGRPGQRACPCSPPPHAAAGASRF